MIILGINSVYHESAACIVKNGKVLVAIEEERFNRKKHGKTANVDNPQELPLAAIEACLKYADLNYADIDKIAYSFSPEHRKAEFLCDQPKGTLSWGGDKGEMVFLTALEKVPNELAKLFKNDIHSMFEWIPHHLCHAASSFFPSNEDKAAILVIDGIAESASTWLGYGENTQIELREQLFYPHSLGFLWEKLSKFLGFSEYDACKVMGMAAYGNPQIYKDKFKEFFQVSNHDFTIDSMKILFRNDTFAPLEAILQQSARKPQQPITQIHYDIAATLQALTEAAILTMVNKLYQYNPTEVLCLAGGVALNCAANWKIAQKGPYKKIFVPTAPHDAGTAIGAALMLHYCQPNVQRQKTVDNLNPYLGPDFSESEIEIALAKAKISAIKIHNKEKLAAQLIAEGKIVSWFQGRMEFGPRALGNRSLLADPRTSKTRQTLNQKVKHREDFRPFGPSVLAEAVHDWFEIKSDSESYQYMLFACGVHPDKAQKIPAVIHADSSSRIQVVKKNMNPSYHKLIKYFYNITKVPMVLNTSFNDCEPIVCSPEDAINTYMKTKIDALFIGDFICLRDGKVPQSFIQ